MTSLGFENYAEALKIYLSKYREVSLVFPSLTPDHSLRSIQTQSARGENQGRPSSSGYGAAGASGGSGQGRSGGFPEGEGSNSLINPGLDPSDQDPAAYAYPPMGVQPHNGAGGDSY